VGLEFDWWHVVERSVDSSIMKLDGVSSFKEVGAVLQETHL